MKALPTNAAEELRAAYEKAFIKECGKQYPQIDAFENHMPFRLPTVTLQHAARTLACPLKRNPPNWQHGRVIYAAARAYITQHQAPFFFLDLGTAKGFSALMLAYALTTARVPGHVLSVDIVDPLARVDRNSAAALTSAGEFRTVREYLKPWEEESARIYLAGGGSLKALERHETRIHFAVVDGKHAHAVVVEELKLIAAHQQHGDVVFMDDLQIPGVIAACKDVCGYDKPYVLEWHLQALPTRQYGLLVRQ